jgi:hypothetical protein
MKEILALALAGSLLSGCASQEPAAKADPKTGCQPISTELGTRIVDVGATNPDAMEFIRGESIRSDKTYFIAVRFSTDGGIQNAVFVSNSLGEDGEIKGADPTAQTLFVLWPVADKLDRTAPTVAAVGKCLS